MCNGVGFLCVCNDGWVMSMSYCFDNSDEVICGVFIWFFIVRFFIVVVGRVLIIVIVILVFIFIVVVFCVVVIGFVGFIFIVVRFERYY